MIFSCSREARTLAITALSDACAGHQPAHPPSQVRSCHVLGQGFRQLCLALCLLVLVAWSCGSNNVRRTQGHPADTTRQERIAMQLATLPILTRASCIVTPRLLYLPSHFPSWCTCVPESPGFALVILAVIASTLSGKDFPDISWLCLPPIPLQTAQSTQYRDWIRALTATSASLASTDSNRPYQPSDLMFKKIVVLFRKFFCFVLCLSWINKARAKEKTYIRVSVRWKTKN